MAADKGLSMIIFGAILLIVGVILTDAIGDYIYDATTLSDRVNETVAAASQTATLTNEDVNSISYFGNATIDFTWLVSTEGFNYTTAGVITTNDTILDGDYNVSYVFEGDAYVNHSTSRTFFKLIPIFFVISILALAIYLGTSKLKELGWI